MNYSYNYTNSLPNQPIIYPPNTTQITQIHDFCIFGSRLVVFGDTNNQPTQNKAFESLNFEPDSSIAVSSLGIRVNTSTNFIMQDCYYTNGALFRSVEPEEKIVYYNSKKLKFYILDEPLSQSKLLSTQALNMNFVMSIIAVPGEYCRLVQADPPTFWQ